MKKFTIKEWFLQKSFNTENYLLPKTFEQSNISKETEKAFELSLYVVSKNSGFETFRKVWIPKSVVEA